MIPDWPTILILGLLAIPYLYILVRVLTRAILRTIEERKRHHNGS